MTLIKEPSSFQSPHTRGFVMKTFFIFLLTCTIIVLVFIWVQLRASK